MHWLIEEDLFGEDYLAEMVNTLEAQKIPFSIVKHIPFSQGKVKIGNKEDYLHQLLPDKVIVYGSINLLKAVEKYITCLPGMEQITWENYRCSIYYPYYSEYLFNYFGDWYPIRWLAKKFDDLIPYEAFIRPDEATKSFKGGRYTKETFLEAITNIDENIWVYVDTVSGEECLLEEEYRLFYINGKVITGSQYRQREKKKTSSDVPSDAVEYVESMLQSVGYMPDEVLAVDIARAVNYYPPVKPPFSKYYLLELSPWACAGLYDCDIPLLVKSVHEHYLGKYPIRRKVGD
jgi:hypothetical protein